MRFKIVPTRMELLRTRRRRDMARRGHKLLKDKLDGLIKNYIGIIKDIRAGEDELRKKIREAFIRLAFASAEMWEESANLSAMTPKQELSVGIKGTYLMGVHFPQYFAEVRGDHHSYSPSQTPLELDMSLKNFTQLIPDLLQLASRVKTLEVLSKEISEIRRRVNSLEHILIPELEQAVGFIKMKLSEMERSYLTSLMKIKDIVRARF